MIARHRVRAFMLRHLYEISATFDRKMDIIFWPTIDLLIFGLLSVYIQRLDVATNAAAAIIGGLMLWTLVYNIQRDISVTLLEDTWSRNLYNLFSTPLKLSEMLIGTLLLSLGKAILTISFTTFLAWQIFHFNLLSVGFMLGFYILNIFVFGWAFGCFTASIIFRFGTRVQIFAWSLIAVLYPISGVFYPISILPGPLASVARLIPVSYIFEGLRGLILHQSLPPVSDLAVILLLNAFYLALGIIFFVRGFKSAKERGWLIHPI
ncbi:MAG: hypothetical protein UY65_C0014G0007 [Parcubacteria group bacterium GW2011_GWA2_51_12]|nr:MAG: hypothetical protein UY65_C0014G0007 [Parcubacteria group bacterium GW2011_GWA2_51_12]